MDSFFYDLISDSGSQTINFSLHVLIHHSVACTLVLNVSNIHFVAMATKDTIIWLVILKP